MADQNGVARQAGQELTQVVGEFVDTEFVRRVPAFAQAVAGGSSA